jgi:SAM-dependent methyltransferase
MKLIREAVLDEKGFVRAVFSAPPRGRSTPWKRIVLRPVEIRGTQHVQFTYYDEAKSIDRNRAGAAADEELTSVLLMPFRDIHVELVDRSLQVIVPGKGDARVKTTTKTTPVDRVLAHDRQKRLPLPSGKPDEYLKAVGIMSADGRVKADRRDKFRQVNEFLRLLGQTIATPAEPFRPRCIVDLGCGNAYLTFAVYHYFTNVLHQSVEMVGVDTRGELLGRHRAKAAELGWDGLSFEEVAIADFDPPRAPDLVMSLHACDTATDDAIARAIRWGSRYVLSAPCCHHELQQQLRRRKDATPLRPVYRYGALAERLGDELTDTFRALILRMFGYRCDVVQFVSSEHTARNLMIRAARAGRVADRSVVEDYVGLKGFLGVTPYLERLLAAEMQGLLAPVQPTT